MDEAELLKHHEILDKILGFVSKSDREFDAYGDIRKQLDIDASDDLMIVLINYMADKGVVDPIKHSGFRDGEDFIFITKNRKTSLFISNGGFEKLSKDQLKQKSENEQSAVMQAEINRLTIVNLHLQNRQLKRYVLYSVISLLAGIGLTEAVHYFTKNTKTTNQKTHESEYKTQNDKLPIDTIDAP